MTKNEEIREAKKVIKNLLDNPQVYGIYNEIKKALQFCLDFLEDYLAIPERELPKIIGFAKGVKEGEDYGGWHSKENIYEYGKMVGRNEAIHECKLGYLKSRVTKEEIKEIVFKIIRDVVKSKPKDIDERMENLPTEIAQAIFEAITAHP